MKPPILGHKTWFSYAFSVLLRVLGSVDLVEDGRRIGPGGPKERAVLAALAVHANHIVSEGLLLEAVWGDDEPPSAVRTLRSYVSRIRHTLNGTSVIAVETRPPGYLLRVGSECLDATLAEHLLGQGREETGRGSFAPAIDILARAGALWTGPSLGEFATEPFAVAEAARLDELRVVITEERLDAELDLGRHREILADLEGLCPVHPLRERLWALRVTALYRSGRQGEALRTYQELRGRLITELGIEPSPKLRGLETAVLAQDPVLDWKAPAGKAAGRPSSVRTHNVPIAVSSFVGRQSERHEILQLLGDVRLVTLVGAPGVGKSRLAFEVAADLLRNHPDGVWVVELAPVAEPALVTQAVASVLSVRERPEAELTDTLLAELACKRLLLVLDNCEHLVVECGRLVQRLVEACPDLVILATSREPLGLKGEWVRRIDPLTVPATDDDSFESLVAHDAVRLFVERGAATPTGLVLTAATARNVAKICRRLDGVPLAIELAAARLEVLSLAEIVEQLGERFRLLRTSARAAAPVHSSLLAALDWSHNLLFPAEAALLRRLSVFMGGCTFDAAETVCIGGNVQPAAVMDLLEALVRKSLIFTDRSRSETRYRLLDTVRD